MWRLSLPDRALRHLSAASAVVRRGVVTSASKTTAEGSWFEKLRVPPCLLSAGGGTQHHLSGLFSRQLLDGIASNGVAYCASSSGDAMTSAALTAGHSNRLLLDVPSGKSRRFLSKLRHGSMMCHRLFWKIPAWTMSSNVVQCQSSGSTLWPLCERFGDDLSYDWYKQFPEKYGMAQFAANAPIQDRCFVHELDLSVGTGLETRWQAREKAEASRIDDDEKVNTADGGCHRQGEKVGGAKGRRSLNRTRAMGGAAKEAEKERRLQSASWQRRQQGAKESDKTDEGENEKKMAKSKNRTHAGKEKNDDRKENKGNGKNKRQREKNSKSDTVVIAAVIDGHGGWQVADMVRHELPVFVRHELCQARNGQSSQGDESGSLHVAMERAFTDLDYELKEAVRPIVRLGFSPPAKCGACVCAIVIRSSDIILANTGDCKALLSQSGKPIPLNRQHNANDPEERSQIIDAHPNESDAVVCRKTWEERRVPSRFVDYPLHWLGRLGREVKCSSCYVKGRLQPTRSFGDFHLKDERFAFDREGNKPFVREPYSFPYITVTPEVSVIPRNKQQEFVVLGSDGVWDFLSDQEVLDVVRSHFSENPDANAASAAEEVVSEVLRKAEIDRKEAELMGSRQRRAKYDDTTVCVMMLNENYKNKSNTIGAI